MHGLISRFRASSSGSRWFVVATMIALVVSSLYSLTVLNSESRPVFRISTGVENQSFFERTSGQDEPSLIEKFEEREGVNIQVDFRGSVDTMLALQHGEKAFDAVWPASSV